MSPAQLFAEVEKVSPGFRPVLAEHLGDYGELLAHVLVADLLRYVGSHLESAEGSSGGGTEIQAILAVLDSGIVSGTDATVNAIAVSFCEHIETEPFFSRLRPLLGPGLRREVGDLNAR